LLISVKASTVTCTVQSDEMQCNSDSIKPMIANRLGACASASQPPCETCLQDSVSRCRVLFRDIRPGYHAQRETQPLESDSLYRSGVRQCTRILNTRPSVLWPGRRPPLPRRRRFHPQALGPRHSRNPAVYDGGAGICATSPAIHHHNMALMH